MKREIEIQKKKKEKFFYSPHHTKRICKKGYLVREENLEGEEGEKLCTVSMQFT